MGDEERRLGEDLPLPGGNRIPADELDEQASRSSGPGGQHVNTSSSRITLRWNLRMTRGLRIDDRIRAEGRLRPRLSRDGTLIVHCGRHRSQLRNRLAARARLQELVSEALRSVVPRKETKPTRGSRKRRLEAKRRRGELKSRRGKRPALDD